MQHYFQTIQQHLSEMKNEIQTLKLKDATNKTFIEDVRNNGNSDIVKTIENITKTNQDSNAIISNSGSIKNMTNEDLNNNIISFDNEKTYVSKFLDKFEREMKQQLNNLAEEINEDDRSLETNELPITTDANVAVLGTIPPLEMEYL